MNIAFLLKPKVSVKYLISTYTLRQCLEKMRRYGYTAIPVVNRDGSYAGTVSEGDFLWYLADMFSDLRQVDQKLLEETPVSKIIRTGSYKPVRIDAQVDELLNVALNQNFVPVIDDLGSFIGIVTRRDIIIKLTNSDDN